MGDAARCKSSRVLLFDRSLVSLALEVDASGIEICAAAMAVGTAHRGVAQGRVATLNFYCRRGRI